MGTALPDRVSTHRVAGPEVPAQKDIPKAARFLPAPRRLEHTGWDKTGFPRAPSCAPAPFAWTPSPLAAWVGPGALTTSRWPARPTAVTDALEGGAHLRVAAAALLVSVWEGTSHGLNQEASASIFAARCAQCRRLCMCWGCGGAGEVPAGRTGPGGTWVSTSGGAGASGRWRGGADLASKEEQEVGSAGEPAGQEVREMACA